MLEWIFNQELYRSLHWSFQTKRYFADGGAEVKKTRFVKLLPRQEQGPVLEGVLA